MSCNFSSFDEWQRKINKCFESKSLLFISSLVGRKTDDEKKSHCVKVNVKNKKIQLKMFEMWHEFHAVSDLFYFSVLIFPPVNSYRRFLIHKVCELVTSSQPKELATFSIGVGDRRRTVVCQRYQLLAELEHDSLKRFVNQFLCLCK